MIILEGMLLVKSVTALVAAVAVANATKVIIEKVTESVISHCCGRIEL